MRTVAHELISTEVARMRRYLWQGSPPGGGLRMDGEVP
jgi:hypothetical protein